MVSVRAEITDVLYRAPHCYTSVSNFPYHLAYVETQPGMHPWGGEQRKLCWPQTKSNGGRWGMKRGMENGVCVRVCVSVCACLCVVSFCLASSRHSLAGEASRLYLFINLQGTGNERQGQYIIADTHARAHICTQAKPFTPPIERPHIQQILF